MHPLLVQMPSRFDRSRSRFEIRNASSDLADACDSFFEIELELIEELNRVERARS